MPSFAAVMRTPLSVPQTRIMKQARHPREASNVSDTVNMTAPIEAVDSSPNLDVLDPNTHSFSSCHNVAQKKTMFKPLF